MTAPDHSAASASATRWGLFAVIISSFIVGVGLGGMSPLLALNLEAQRIPSLIIGLNSAMAPLGVIVGALLVPRLLNRCDPTAAMAGGMIVSALILLLFGLTTDLLLWFVLRFSFGLMVALPWVVGEAWLNAAVGDAKRGRVMSYYAIALATGFMLGPAILYLTGRQGLLPFAIFAVMILASAGPIWFARRGAPDLQIDRHMGAVGVIWIAPTIFVAGLVQGLLDGGIFSFLPIYGARHGFDDALAALALAIFTAGNIVLQLPLGYLLDKVNRRGIMIVAAILMTVLPLFIPLLIDQLVALSVVLFLWGGVVWGSYTIALAMMGDRFKAGQITLVNATFVIVMEWGNLAGNPIAGVAIDLDDSYGLILYFVGCSSCLLLTAIWRGVGRN